MKNYKNETMYDSLAVDYRLSQEENERLNKNNQAIWQIAEDYKSRNEKAIEYIHNHQPVFELSNKKQIQEWFEKLYYIELLNILNGGDEEC